MSKIYISTNIEKAKSCFNRSENDKSKAVESILKINEKFPILQIENTQLYFHFDKSNPDSIIIENSDLLLYHSQTNGFNKQNGFIHKFKNKEHSSHPGKFKDVFEILINDGIQNKYNAIKSAIFPNVSSQIIGQIGGQFLESGGIVIEQIKGILGKNYNVEIENLINQNLNYHQKKSDNTNTKEDDNQNNKNWYVLESKLKSTNEK